MNIRSECMPKHVPCTFIDGTLDPAMVTVGGKLKMAPLSISMFPAT